MRTDVYQLEESVAVDVVSLCIPVVTVIREDGNVVTGSYATVKIHRLRADEWHVAVYRHIDAPLWCWVSIDPPSVLPTGHDFDSQANVIADAIGSKVSDENAALRAEIKRWRNLAEERLRVYESQRAEITSLQIERARFANDPRRNLRFVGYWGEGWAPQFPIYEGEPVKVHLKLRENRDPANLAPEVWLSR